MSDYYMGLLIGAGAGYCGALITMVAIWGLCAAAHREDQHE